MNDLYQKLNLIKAYSFLLNRYTELKALAEVQLTAEEKQTEFFKGYMYATSMVMEELKILIDNAKKTL